MFRILLSALVTLALVAGPVSLSDGTAFAAQKEKKGQKQADRTPDVVYVPTPQDVVHKMLDLAKVRKGDVVYDLGCGDGRIVVTAARKYGARGIGFDIDPDRIKESNENVEKNKVGDRVEIKDQDIFTVDLSKADVLTLYLLPRLNRKLVPQIQKMKPGSRVVSHNYDISGYKPDKEITMTSREDNAEHTIYLWTVPLKKEADEE